MLISLITFLVFAVGGFQKEDLIEWNATRRLTWNDFKGPPDTQSPNAALTISSINIEFEYSGNKFDYNITCNFDKSRSWVRVKNNEVLAHEQGHFDLAELFARKLNKAMKEYHYNEKTANDDVNRIYENMMKLHHETQTTYDQETDYSRSRVKQEEWLKKIEADIKSLQAFAKYRKP